MKTILCMLALISAAQCQEVKEERSSRTLRFPVAGTQQSLLVDNIQGPIVVTTHDGETVEMTVIRRTQAKSETKFQEAAEDVSLDIQEQRDRIEIVVETPWRSRWWEGRRPHGYRYYGYDVTFEFELKVPRTIDLYLHTVNGGDIEVRDVKGSFEIKNVNGNVVMSGISGSGHASSVNGSVTVGFRENPVEKCLFHTVNGGVEVSFQDPLSAELHLKTFNGKAYTDFDVTASPKSIPKINEKRGKRTYRTGDAYVVQVGEGGPQLAFDTLNGSIHILKHQ